MFTPILYIVGKYEMNLELLKLKTESNYLNKTNVCKQKIFNYINLRQKLENKVLFFL